MMKRMWVAKANRNHVNSIFSQLVAPRLMVAPPPPNYTTLNAAPPISTERDYKLIVGDGDVSPCVDLFFNVVKPDRDAPPSEKEDSCRYLKRLLPLAWSHNPLTTLKLIWNLLQDKPIGTKKTCRDGKYYTHAFYTAAYWLHQNHPKTLACNIASIPVSFGSFNHTVHVLHRILQGQDMRAGVRDDHDPNYKLLHDRVSDLFVEHLKSDIENLKQSRTKGCGSNIGLAARYCLYTDTQNLVHALDTTMIIESIASKFYPRAEYQGVTEDIYTDLVLSRLRKEVLVPLNEAFSSPTNDAPGTVVEERSCVIEKYLGEVKAGKVHIAAGALLPHEIIRYVHYWNFGKVAELQWMFMVEDIKKQGKMQNCLAVCDINKTFKDEIPIALGLLVSELSEEPWKGKVVNHDCFPELHLIQGDDFRYKFDSVRRLYPINRSHNFERLFDVILEVAVKANLKPEQMIRKVFVFSHQDYDYEYDQSYGKHSSWKTEYRAIHRKFKDKGYGDVVPHIVFWTLSDYEPNKPEMPYKEPGLTILRGFSNELLKLFLENDGDISPEHVMEEAISGKEYQNLDVVD